MIDESRRENTHETRQHHQVRFVAVDHLDQRGVEGFAGVILTVGQGHRVDPGIPGSLEPVGVGLVGDHGDDFAATELLVLLGVQQRLQVAAVAGDQYHHPRLLGRGGLEVVQRVVLL